MSGSTWVEGEKILDHDAPRASRVAFSRDEFFGFLSFEQLESTSSGFRANVLICFYSRDLP
jgi:hypothetical protein